MKVINGIDRFLVLADAEDEKICFLMDQNNGNAITDPTIDDEILDEEYYKSKKQLPNTQEYILSDKHTEFAKIIVSNFLENKKIKKQAEFTGLVGRLQWKFD